MSTHAEDLKLRLMTIELLRTAKYKRNITYRELASKTGLPVTVLSRYAKGHVLPNTTRAKQLWRVLTKMVGLEAELRNRIKFDDSGYFDNTEIVGDYNILQQAANHALANFAGKRAQPEPFLDVQLDRTRVHEAELALWMTAPELAVALHRRAAIRADVDHCDAIQDTAIVFRVGVQGLYDEPLIWISCMHLGPAHPSTVHAAQAPPWEANSRGKGSRPFS